MGEPTEIVSKIKARYPADGPYVRHLDGCAIGGCIFTRRLCDCGLLFDLFSISGVLSEKAEQLYPDYKKDLDLQRNAIDRNFVKDDVSEQT